MCNRRPMDVFTFLPVPSASRRQWRWFLSSLVVMRFTSSRSADQPTNKTAEERGADFAPILRVERVVVAMVMAMVVLRRVMPLRRRRRRSPVDDFALRRVPCGSNMVFRRLPRRGGSLDRASFWRRRSHRRGCFAAVWMVAFWRGDYRSAKYAAYCESHHQLLYCLVHCRVPFVFRASPFSRLHRVRTSRQKFLTKFPEQRNPSAFASFMLHGKVAVYPERLDFGII